MPEQISNNDKKPFWNIFTILALVAILVIGGYFIFSKKVINKTSNTGTATLSWSANTESDLAGYKIYYGSSPRNDSCPEDGYQNKVDVGKTETPEKPSHTLKELENGKKYYFSITSYDSAGNESCFSEETNKMINP